MSDPSPIPLLPRQEVVFDSIPARAVVLEELPAALGTGAVVISDGASVGVVIARDGALDDACVVAGGERTVGPLALDRIRQLPDATVHAVRLDAALLDALSPVLLWGTVHYADLRLGWTDWYQLIADLRSRDGTYLVELSTPEERGVTVITDGEHLTTYSESHPQPGDPSLLDRLARHPAGTVWVHHVASGEPHLRSPAEHWRLSPLGEGGEPAGAQAHPGIGAPALTGGPGMHLAAEIPPEGDPTSRPETSPHAALPLAQETTPQPAEFGGETTPASLPFADPAFGAPYRPPVDAPSGHLPDVHAGSAATGDADDPRPDTLRGLLPDLRMIARDRLQLSAPRVERVLDEAAQANRPVESVFADIRTMAIRGVMRSTLSEMVDDMQALARRRSSGEVSAPG